MRHIGLVIGILTESVWQSLVRRFEPTRKPFFWLDAEAREAALERDTVAREHRNA